MDNIQIYSVFNSSSELLGTFSIPQELYRFIRRRSRDSSDTTVLRSDLNSWHEHTSIEDVTKEVCAAAYSLID